MKTLATAIVMGAVATAATAQVNYQMQVACNPQDVKTYDTERLRSSFMMDKVMVADEINLTYSMYDRFIFGGAVPVQKELVLETIDPLKAQYFLERRELGVINIGGDGIVTVDGKEYELRRSRARTQPIRPSSTSTRPLPTKSTRRSSSPSTDAKAR